ncbi:MAG TPA: four helix bundle protein [Bacteroidetes bacterium]|nr:four helix bundle protein [Bacteroidota bacterium]
MAKIENEFVKVFKKRTKKFAIDTLKLCDELPYNQNSTRIISNQLGRSASSVAANYRAACVSRSDKEFVSKVSISIEEGDESCFWLEVLDEGDFYSDKGKIKDLLDEADQITRVISRSRQTMWKKLNLKP